jgi:hypothetical protein
MILSLNFIGLVISLGAKNEKTKFISLVILARLGNGLINIEQQGLIFSDRADAK